ncbi:5-oxoprolinase subunit C family protein [Luethyella okanaganae]|uniref:Biotin-dependent carboxyltransferase family protein n=1 Tax=Luethyella okanaganae TaxID=69372 RepID=A0ABW1VG02_9MICO
MSALHVLEAGPLTLVQDLGRPGHAAIGVSPSGALDRASLRLANRLVGNAEGAAAFEIAVGGFAARFDGVAWVAVTGAWGSVEVDGRSLAPDVATPVAAGSELRFGVARRGLRYYLAVRGGLEVPTVLGSRSRDTLSGLGPDPAAVGDVFAIGSAPTGGIPLVDAMTIGPPDDGVATIGLTPGPRADWVSTATLERLFDQPWTISTQSNRVGARLDGRPLERLDRGELPSEGMVAGSVQLSPSGLPTVLLADHPVTGGYPVIAVVADASLDVFGQLRPGQQLRFRHARPL